MNSDTRSANFLTMEKEIIEYTSSVLLTYLSGMDVTTLVRPFSTPYEVVVYFCMMQFKALRELGLPISMEKLRNLFAPISIPDLDHFPFILKQNDNTARIFLDFQGSVEKPQEIVALFSRGIQVVDLIHLLGFNRTPTHHEKQLIKHVHGLVRTSSRAIGREQMIKSLKEFIEICKPAEIIIARKESTKLLKGYKKLMISIELNKWKYRASHYSYHAAVQARFGASQDQLLLTTRSHCNHSAFQAEEFNPRMGVGSLIRLSHGPQCSLWTTYEMLHFHLAMPCTIRPAINPPDSETSPILSDI